MEVLRDHGDATQASLLLQSTPMGFVRDHGDATQASLLLQSTPTGFIRDHGDATQAKLVEQGGAGVGSGDQVGRDPDGLPTPTVSASSGSEIEWPQLGIGFGLRDLARRGTLACDADDEGSNPRPLIRTFATG